MARARIRTAYSGRIPVVRGVQWPAVLIASLRHTLAVVACSLARMMRMAKRLQVDRIVVARITVAVVYIGGNHGAAFPGAVPAQGFIRQHMGTQLLPRGAVQWEGATWICITAAALGLPQGRCHLDSWLQLLEAGLQHLQARFAFHHRYLGQWGGSRGGGPRT